MPSSTECIERESQDDIERFCEAAAAVKQDCRPEDQVIMDAIAKSEGEKYAPQAAEKLDKSAGAVRVRWLRLKELLAQCIANHVDSTVDNIKERLQGICLPLYVDQGLLHKILNSQLPTKLALIAASSIMIITGTFIGREILQQPPYNFEASESTKTDVLNLFKITLQWTEPTVQEGDVITPSAGQIRPTRCPPNGMN